MNIIFDLGCVLIDWNPDKVLKRRYADAAQRELLKQSIFYHADWLALDHGTLTEQAAMANFHARTNFSHTEITVLLQEIRESLTPIEENWALLYELQQQGCPLYCLSNMTAGTFAFLKTQYDRWHVFKGIVISGEVNMIKPEPEIFEYLLNRFNLTPERTIFIDDLEANVLGARAAGMHAIQFRDADDCRRRLQLIHASFKSELASDY
jgi:putative hydrolase of the HAD superfamily